MPLEPKEVQAFEDMLRYGTDAIGYVQGVEFDSFVADHRTQHATMYAIATVAEASRRIPDERHQEWSDIPWPMKYRSTWIGRPPEGRLASIRAVL